MASNGLEIEHKFLIVCPKRSWLEAHAKPSRIVQTYLCGRPGETERVRLREDEKGTVYTHTIKQRLSGITRREDEEEIDLAEYEALLKRKDPKRETVYKQRWVLEQGGLCFEIDIYPFWQDRAIMEVELEREDQPVDLPCGIEILEDVSRDPSYTNSALARRLANGEI